MIIKPMTGEDGRFLSPIPMMITDEDVERFKCGREPDREFDDWVAPRLNRPCQIERFTPVLGSTVSQTNMFIRSLNGIAARLRDCYFAEVKAGRLRAGTPLRYDGGNIVVAEDIPEAPGEQPEEQPREQPEDRAITDFRLLLSTRRMLGHLGSPYYDGPEFKFESNKHPSPAATYLPTLAKEYMMKVIIPNALLALKYGASVGNVVMDALDHCMTTSKSQKSVDAWKEMRADQAKMKEIAEKYNFYVVGVNRDGSPVKPERRCYFDKFVNLKAKDAKKFKKSKNADVVADLIKRMEKEPELRKMSHRELMAMGISDRPARTFMQARKKA